MTRKISKRDWEVISTYLDGQLSARKQVRLETRLQQDPQLRQALYELQETRQVLRSTPRLRAPRNFLLTPEMVGQQHRLPRLAPFFGWASAAASLLLVLVLVGDIFSIGGAVSIAAYQDSNQTIPSQVGMAPESEVFGESAALEGAAAGGYTEPATFVVPDEEAPMEAAAVEEAEAIVAQEVEPTATPEVAMAASDMAVEEPTAPSQADREASTVGEGTAVVLAVPSETNASDAKELEQPEEMPEYVEGGILTDIYTPDIPPTVTTTQLAENATASPTEAPLAEDVEQLQAEKAIPLAPQMEKAASGTEPTDLAALATEIVSAEEQTQRTQEAPIDILIGVEIILALSAVGLGIAWLYLHRRGG